MCVCVCVCVCVRVRKKERKKQMVKRDISSEPVRILGNKFQSYIFWYCTCVR